MTNHTYVSPRDPNSFVVLWMTNVNVREGAGPHCSCPRWLAQMSEPDLHPAMFDPADWFDIQREFRIPKGASAKSQSAER
jgi:hypothetical protein